MKSSLQILFSLILILYCSGCMSEVIARKYNIDNNTPPARIQSEFPEVKPYKAYYVGTDIELKMNTEDYIVVRIDGTTFRFVPRNDVENRLRQQMSRPITLRQ